MAAEKRQLEVVLYEQYDVAGTWRDGIKLCMSEVFCPTSRFQRASGEAFWVCLSFDAFRGTKSSRRNQVDGWDEVGGTVLYAAL